MCESLTREYQRGRARSAHSAVAFLSPGRADFMVPRYRLGELPGVRLLRRGEQLTIGPPGKAADGVDLSGFVVRGAYDSSATPPNCPALAGHGIRLGAAGRMTLHGGTIDHVGGTGVLLETSSTATIERVTVSQTGGRGIDALGHVTVRESAVHSTQADGIHALSAKVLDTRVSSTRGDAIDNSDRGLVWGVETTNNFAAGLRLIGNVAGYSLCRLDRTPIGGKNLGQNLCGDVGTGACP